MGLEIRIVRRIVKRVTDSLGTGPDLYFYRKLLKSRCASGTIECFIGDPQNLELAYALLGLWNRAAHMRDFRSFVECIQQARGELMALESALTQGDAAKIMQYLGAAYDRVHVMTGKSKLISNAKLFHFFLPEHLMPVDGDNTLGFLCGKNGKENRYE